MKDASPLSGRLPSLDGLRGVSIAMVILQHASLSRSFPFPLAPYGDAGFGVHIFFVISGFIITLLLLNEEREAGRISLSQFYFRRVIRILPPFWTFLLLMLLARRIYVGELFQAATFTSGLALWTTPATWYTGHTWSLAVEEQFYLLWPAALVLLARTSWRVLLLIAVVALANFSRWWAMIHSASYWSVSHPGHWWSLFESIWHLMGVRTFLSHIDLIACGCLLAIALRRKPSIVIAIAHWRPAIGRPLAVVVMYCASGRLKSIGIRYDVPVDAMVNTVRGLLIAYLIASYITIQRGWSYRLLNSRPAVIVGLMSYSLYIWQQAFVGPGHEPPLWCEAWPINLAFIALFGAGSYLYIERPMRRLRHIRIGRLWNRERNGGHARRVGRACAG